MLNEIHLNNKIKFVRVFSVKKVGLYFCDKARYKKIFDFLI